MVTSRIYTFYFILIAGTILNSSCYNVTISTPSFSGDTIVKRNFIAGINMEAPRNEIDSNAFGDMKKINASWVSLIPFAFSRQGTSAVQFNNKRQWWGETAEGIVACIKMAHSQNLKVMLKPQLWLAGGEYCGYFKMDTDTGWIAWEENYKKYIMHNAVIAAQNDVEILCIGTEMDAAVRLRQQYWNDLIDTVKKVYKGKLTYAANWGCYKEFNSWQKLDFVGIDAYFPLSNSVTPSVDELFIGWKPHFEDISHFEKKINKPILFTEYGYRSIDKCAEQPWLSYNNAPTNLTGQQNAYEALYKRFMPEKWFAGGFLWKWHVNNNKPGGPENSNYTPQNKPVEAVIKKWYGQNTTSLLSR